jgi:hypothetical protein
LLRGSLRNGDKIGNRLSDSRKSYASLPVM